MTKTQQHFAIEKENSDIRIRLHELLALTGDKETPEVRSEREGLEKRLETGEKKFNASVVAKLAEQELASVEDRQYGELVTRSSVGNIFTAAVEHRQTDGPEKELQDHLGLSANQIPLSLLEEERAVTPGPSDVGQSQSPVAPGVFPQSAAGYLGVEQPRVPSGEAVFLVLTKNAEVKTPAENASSDETTGSFSADVLTPKRLQAAFFFSREDRARFPAIDSSLRENLSMALADGLDQQIIAGASGLLTGTNLPNNNRSSITDFASYLSDFAFGRVDGAYAGGAPDLRILMGSDSYAHCDPSTATRA